MILLQKPRFFDLILFPDNELFGEETEVFVDGRPFPMQHVLSVMYSGHDIGKSKLSLRLSWVSSSDSFAVCKIAL